MKPIKELLLNLSAKLLGAHPSKIGQEIDDGLKLIGGYWELDRITLIEFSVSSDDVRIIHSYEAPGVPKAPLKNISESVPWIFGELSRGRTVLSEKLPDDLPDGAEVDRHYVTQVGLKSALALPLKIGTSILGGCLFASCKERQSWKKEMLKESHYLAAILTGALERERSVKKITQLLRFEHLLSEVSATYINLPRNRLDEVIKRDLGRLSRLMGVDRGILYTLDPETGRFGFTPDYAWWPEEDNQIIADISKWHTKDVFMLGCYDYYFDKWHRGEVIKYEKLDDLPDEAAPVKELYRRLGTKSGIYIPVTVAGVAVGAIALSTVRKHRTWPEDLIPRLRLFGEVLANAVMRKRNEEEIEFALSEVRTLKDQIEADYHYLAEEISLEHDFKEIVGKSQALQRILVKVKQVAPTNAPVLLLGETGTGKGVIARTIHDTGNHSGRPMIQVNCAALSPSLIESELFGHEKGAFSGAVARREGRFEQACGTTLFLDEIGELPMELQAKLLRVLQDGEFERVGGGTTLKTDARVIAATNRDLEQAVAEGKFRRDLYYRLNVFPILIPPLRERLEDIPLFVIWFAEKFSKGTGKKFKKIPQTTFNALKRCPWNGNIRELENLVERAVIISPDDNLQIEIPSSAGSPAAENTLTLQDVEKRHLLKVLDNTDWRIEGPGGAAMQLGLNPSTLRFRMKKLHIQRPLS
jgi:transcriptional regulator with GAF, ATPase, and Fis domain